MKKYTYLNETFVSNKEIAGIKGAKKENVIINIERQTNILDNDTKDYLLSVDMFHLHSVRMPLFKPSQRSYNLGVTNVGTGDTFYRDVDFSSFVEEDGFMYDYRDVASAINETLYAVCETDLSIPVVDIPEFTFDKSNLRFEIKSTLDFRTDYEILFNDDLRVDFNSFEFDRIDETYEMVVLSDDVEIQDSGTLEFLSPISRIVLESQGLPVQYELLPPQNGSINTVSNNSAVFITDYKYVQNNNQDIQSILFESKSTDHRYHNVKNTLFSKFSLFFTLYDYDNNKYPLTLLPQSKIQIKLMFYTE